MSQATETLLNHVKELSAIVKSMEPGDNKDRIEAKRQEALIALRMQTEKENESNQS